MNERTSNVVLSGLRWNHPWRLRKSSKVPSGSMLSYHDTCLCITSFEISCLFLEGKPQRGLMLKQRLNRSTRLFFCSLFVEIQSAHKGIASTMRSLRKDVSSNLYSFTHLSIWNMTKNVATRRHPSLINVIHTMSFLWNAELGPEHAIIRVYLLTVLQDVLVNVRYTALKLGHASCQANRLVRLI